jgi:hypothetical protein
LANNEPDIDAPIKISNTIDNHLALVLENTTNLPVIKNQKKP